jgi:hypothetical protein
LKSKTSAQKASNKLNEFHQLYLVVKVGEPRRYYLYLTSSLLIQNS